MKIKNLMLIACLIPLIACSKGHKGGGGAPSGTDQQASPNMECKDLQALGVWYSTLVEETITLKEDCTGISDSQCPFNFSFTKPYTKQDGKTYTGITITQYNPSVGCPAREIGILKEYEFQHNEPTLVLLSQGIIVSSYSRTKSAGQLKTKQDFNGDGIEDLIVGAPSDNPVEGAAYIFFGSANLPATKDASTADTKIVGEVGGDRFGESVASGDLNNDGISDLVVGATNNGIGGAIYIFHGAATLAGVVNASTANVKFVGDVGDAFGESSVSLSDINNDGFLDLIVGARLNNTIGTNAGAVYIFYGSATMTGTISASAANIKITGAVAGDQFGNSVATGDVNKDGFVDIIVGSLLNSAKGATYIFYGAASLPSYINATSANIKITGAATDDQFGNSVASGDVNNDGYADIIVGAKNNDTGGLDSGTVYTFYGSATLASTINATAANVKIIGAVAGDRFGEPIITRDVNKDGFADIVAGSVLNGANGTSYIFYGSTMLASSMNASAANVKLTGENSGDHFGTSFTSRDINNDGILDLIVGAAHNGVGGATYIFYGTSPLLSTIGAGLANVKIFGEASVEQFGSSLR